MKIEAKGGISFPTGIQVEIVSIPEKIAYYVQGNVHPDIQTEGNTNTMHCGFEDSDFEYRPPMKDDDLYHISIKVDGDKTDLYIYPRVLPAAQRLDFRGQIELQGTKDFVNAALLCYLSKHPDSIIDQILDDDSILDERSRQYLSHSM